MPTYEYECKNCSWQFELFQNMNDLPKESCPRCGGVLRRLIGRGSGIIFKGTGFYATDYRRKEDKKEAKQASPAKNPCAQCSSNSSCENKKG